MARQSEKLLLWLLMVGNLVVLWRQRRWHALAFAGLVTYELTPIEYTMDLRLGMSIFPVLCCAVLARELLDRRHGAARLVPDERQAPASPG